MKSKQQKTNETSSHSTKDYEELGRLLKKIYETGYPSNKKFYAFSFMRGVFAGLGSVVGATIVVALLLWTLSLFDSLPFIESISNKLEQSTQNR